MTGSTGVTAVTVPTRESTGQPAGFASNMAAVHAFCSVVSLEGSCLGKSTLTLAALAIGTLVPAPSTFVMGGVGPAGLMTLAFLCRRAKLAVTAALALAAGMALVASPAQADPLIGEVLKRRDASFASLGEHSLANSRPPTCGQ